MDSIISSAVEEICVNQGTLTLSLLWHKLKLKLKLKIDLSSGVKQSIWKNLKNVPTIELRVKNKVYSPGDPSIQCFEDAERLNLQIVANQTLQDNFLGLYDVPLATSKVSSDQRRTLEHIAVTRRNGITQNQLGEELGIERNRLGYDMKKLESSGLIVRQKAEEWTKEACNGGESKSCLNVHTNLVHLRRYAEHLGSHQRFEITKEEQIMNSDSKVGFQDHVFVKDYLPEMKAVCEKLERANGKVLVVSDIKRELGFVGGRSKHRAWRTISNRMQNDHIVEQFNAEVNGKVECCLRLLKKFSPKTFHAKSIGGGGDEQMVKFGRQQNTNQLLDLSIEHQIYDIIDAKKSEGLTSIEVRKRLGLENKINTTRLCNIIKRFGMHLQREMHKKTEVYRIWTASNFIPDSSTLLPSVSKKLVSESSNQDVIDTAAEDDFATYGKANEKGTDSELSCGLSRGSKSNQHMLLCPDNLRETLQEPRGKSPGAKLDIVCAPTGKNIAPSATKTPPLSMPLIPSPCPGDPSQFLTADTVRREQRILERLQEEKFVLKIELYRWLVDLQKDKGTKMDRRTLKRSIHKLEQNGHCKCVSITIPVTRKCKTDCDVDVVLHPSVGSLSPELIHAVHDKYKSFRRKLQEQTSCQFRNNKSVPVLDSIERTKTQVAADALAARLVAMRANGFIVGKMVRAKLLHSFLWNHISSSPGWTDAVSCGKHVHDPRDPQNLFDIEAAIKNIPLELFLQIVGTTKKVDNLMEKSEKGLRLCDLPVQELKYLKDTQATSRLSLVISILQWLKLIRLVTSGYSEDGVKIPRATPVYAMELNAYIEEPPSKNATYSTLDLCPKIRHDFVLSSREAVDEYWQTLEYCYATADKKAASQTFPGSVVREVFSHQSWASVQSMTAKLHAEALMHIGKDDPTEKLPFEECKRIAKELNIHLGQVLRVYNAKHRKCLKRIKRDLNDNGEECQQLQSEHRSSSQKRKRSPDARSVKCRRVDNENGKLSKQILLESASMSNTFKDEKNLSSTSPAKHGKHLLAYQANDHQTAEEAGVNEVNEHKMKRKRKRRFLWTEEADRTLIIQYVRYRVALGAKFNRVYWESINDLPAPPSVCRKRMSFLKQYTEFRKALMRFCNLLCKRYEKQLERRQKQSEKHDGSRLLKEYSGAGLTRNFFDDIENVHHTGVGEYQWDDVSDKKIKGAFLDVLQCKQIAIVEAYKRAVCVSTSQFPTNTGKHAAKFSSWLNENERDLKKAGVNLPENLHCGDIFHLFAVVSSGELSISTRLPDEGVGEAEGAVDNDEFYDGRREKGFPGLLLSAHLIPVPRANAVEQSQAGKTCTDELVYRLSNTSCQQNCNISSELDQRMETLNSPSAIPIASGFHSISMQEGCPQGYAVLPEAKDAGENLKLYAADRTINQPVYKKFRSRVFSTIMQNPGILEDNIIRWMRELNPQSCRMLLNLMVEENFLVVRKMHQTTSNGAPNMLKNLFGNSSGQPKTICRKHFFANPMKVPSL